MTRIKAGDININYEIEGKGFPVLTIWGYARNLDQCRLTTQILAHDFKIIRFDNRGTGDTDMPAGAYSVNMMVDDCINLLKVLGINKAHIWGTSMGGMIAQELAISYPEYVQSLVLGATTCGAKNQVPPPEESVTFLKRYSVMDHELTGKELEYQARLGIVFDVGEKYAQNHPDVIKKLVETAIARPTPLASYISQGAGLYTWDSYDRLPSIKSPTLVMCGRNDPLVNYKNSELIAGQIPNAELVVFNNATHFFEITREDRVYEVVRPFLERNSK